MVIHTSDKSQTGGCTTLWMSVGIHTSDKSQTGGCTTLWMSVVIHTSDKSQTGGCTTLWMSVGIHTSDKSQTDDYRHLIWILKDQIKKSKQTLSALLPGFRTAGVLRSALFFNQLMRLQKKNPGKQHTRSGFAHL